MFSPQGSRGGSAGLLPWSGALNVAAVVFAFLTITVARFVIETSSDGITFLYVVPTTMLALQFGIRGVIVGTGTSFALFLLWAATDADGYSIGAPGFVIRPFVYAAPALIVAAVAESRRRDRIRLADTASLLEAIAKASPEGLLAKDAAGRYLFVNDAAAAIAGLAPEQMIGRTDADMLTPAAAREAERLDADVMKLSEAIEITGALEREDGRHVFRTQRGPLVAPDGSVRGTFALVRDITDEERHQSYYRIQHRIAERLVERPPLAELPDLVLGELITAHDVKWAAYWVPAGEGGRYRCTAVAGTDVPVEAGEERELGGVPDGFHVSWREPRVAGSGSTALIPGPQDGVAMVAYRGDVPDAETIEAIFKPTMLMVGNYVERTLAANDAERTKNEFFGLVSHELRTPLTSIIGYVELLDEIEADNLSPQGRSFVEVIDRNARRELRLVQDLLLLVRLEGGTFTLEREATDLCALIESSCEIVRPQAEANGVRIVTDLAETGRVWIDPHRIGQAVDNLLTNAIKFSESGDEINVRLGAAERSAVIEVEDEGLGVPEEEVERLFDRLFRASDAIEKQIQGTGLGLTIVKSVVEAHGGKVAVASRAGVGTKFTIELPLEHESAGAAAERFRPRIKERVG